MNSEKLQEILDKHRKWLNGEEGGERADLRGAGLQRVNLQKANLQWVDLQRADLRWTDLRGADLRRADLQGADLQRADLRGVDLRGADLRGVDLRGADLRGVDLRGVNLQGANLRGADLTQVVHTETILHLQCPEEGSFIAWKKLAGDNIAKLLIPEDAKRSSATSRKCRASKAIVLAIYNKCGREISMGRSIYDFEFAYRVGETVHADRWDEDRWNECSNGIHFFITRREAEEY